MARLATEAERHAAVDVLRRRMRASKVGTTASDEDLLRMLGDTVAAVGAKELKRRDAGLPLPSDYPHPKAGDRFVVRFPFVCLIGTEWRSPFSGGKDAFLPTGLEFVVQHDPPESASAVIALPDAYDEWAELLIEGSDRKHPKFAGYHLSVGLDDLEINCDPVAIEKGPARKS